MLVGGNSNSCWNFPPQTLGKVSNHPKYDLRIFFSWLGWWFNHHQPAMILRAVASHSQATHPQRLQTESAAGRSQDPFDTMNLGVRTTTSCFDLCFLVVAYQMQEKLQSPKIPSNMWMYLQGTVYLYITMGSTYI